MYHESINVQPTPQQCTTHHKTHNVRRLLNLPRGSSADRFIAAALNAQCTAINLHNVSTMQLLTQPDTWLLADRFIVHCCSDQSTNVCPTQCKMHPTQHWSTFSPITGSKFFRAPSRSEALALTGILSGAAQGARGPQTESTPNLTRCVRPP